MTKTDGVIQTAAKAAERNTTKTLVSLRLPDALLIEIDAAKRPDESRTDAIIRLIVGGLHPPVIIRSAPAPTMPGYAVQLHSIEARRRGDALARPLDPITGEPIPERKPYQKGTKR